MGTVKFIDHVRTCPCLVCEHPAEAHHLMIVGGRGVGKKSSDNTTVPLCHPHHMELHALGDEFRFWEKHSINPLEWLDKNLDIFMEQRTKPTQKEKQCG